MEMYHETTVGLHYSTALNEKRARLPGLSARGRAYMLRESVSAEC